MTPTGVLLVTPIFLWGVGFASLLAGRPRVALALHNARCGTPFWVTMFAESLKEHLDAVLRAGLRASAADAQCRLYSHRITSIVTSWAYM